MCSLCRGRLGNNGSKNNAQQITDALPKSLYTVALFTPIDVAIEKAMGPSEQAGLYSPSDKNSIIFLTGTAFKVSQLAKKAWAEVGF